MKWHSGFLLAGFFITVLIRGVSWCASTLLKFERVVATDLVSLLVYCRCPSIYEFGYCWFGVLGGIPMRIPGG